MQNTNTLEHTILGNSYKRVPDALLNMKLAKFHPRTPAGVKGFGKTFEAL